MHPGDSDFEKTDPKEMSAHLRLLREDQTSLVSFSIVFPLFSSPPWFMHDKYARVFLLLLTCS